ncbi:MAG: alpha-hydroxy-acid oxidizing protein [Lachnospiraceae bacterium]|nr:alpha-hydroxy-acid oxidizing protein [Lachnospiraceae bacterium]
MTLTGPWPGPKGLIPEPEINPENANLHTRKYLDEILVEERIIDAGEADIGLTLFGESFSSAIMMPAFSHLDKVGENGRTPMVEYAQAAKNMSLVNWVGMEPDEEYRKIADVGARTIRIIKPFADHSIVQEQIAVAEETGALAVGMDIDHVIGDNGKYDVVDGILMGTISVDGLRKLVDSTPLPFIAKGVLSISDAIKCREAGVKGIVISHHHGRMPFAIPPLMALPEIKKALAGSGMKLFVDCGINTGYDAYKALALGADAVSVGRGILPGLLKKGSSGVEEKVQKMNEELAVLMGYTGVRNLGEMDPTVLWYHGKRMVSSN